MLDIILSYTSINNTKFPGEQNLFSSMLRNLMSSSVTKVFQKVEFDRPGERSPE